MNLQEKKDTNTWDHINDFLKVLKLMKEKKWTWLKNSPCKYVNLCIDMRDGGCIIMDRDKKRIDVKDLEYQYSLKEEEEKKDGKTDDN